MTRTALVTGGTRGIGFGIARALAQDGWTLAVAGVRPEADVRAALDSLRAPGGIVHYLRGDLADRGDRVRIAADVHASLGPVNALVNNAGRAPRVRADLLDASEESFEELPHAAMEHPTHLRPHPGTDHPHPGLPGLSALSALGAERSLDPSQLAISGVPQLQQLPKLPALPEGTLALAAVDCPPDSLAMSAQNLATRRVTMDQLQQLLREADNQVPLARPGDEGEHALPQIGAPRELHRAVILDLVHEPVQLRVRVENRGPDTATLHVLPTLWFRNDWSAWIAESNRAAQNPNLTQMGAASGTSAVRCAATTACSASRRAA